MQKIKKFLFHNTSTKQTVAKNTFWLFFSEIVSRALKIFLVVYATRVLGKEAWGVFSYALSLVGIFMIFSDMGLSTFLTNKASQDDEEKELYISTTFYLKSFLMFISFLMIIIFAPLTSKIPEAKNLFNILALTALFDSFRAFVMCIVRVNQKMEQEGFIKIIITILVVLSGFYLLGQVASPKNLALAYLIGSIGGTILLVLFVLPTFKKIFLKFSKDKIWAIWNFSWPITIIGLFSTIMFNIDTYALGIWRTTGEIGLYSAAQRLVQFFYIIPGLFSLILFPFFAKFIQDSADKFVILSQKSMRVILLIAFPITIFGVLTSKELIVLAFGSEYIEAATTLSILMLSVLFVFPNFVLDNIIISLNKQKQFISPILIALIVNTLLNILLIPSYGIEGGAIAIVISQGVILCMTGLKLRKISGFSTLSHLPKIIVSNVCLIFLILLGKNMQLHILIIISASVVLYGLILYAIKEPIIHEIKTLITK